MPNKLIATRISIGATDTFVAYAPQVEDFILPQTEDVEKAVQELMKY